MTTTPYQKILVTGGAGFIGSNFVHYWLNKYPDSRLINLDALTYAGNLANLEDLADNSNYVFIEGNILDKQLVDKIFADGIDAVVHFAAETHVDRSILEPAVFLETNVLGTQVLLEAALTYKVKRFHHISTDEVFGSLELNTAGQFSENTPYDPRSPYSASKAAADHLVRAYGETFGLAYTLTNCSNNYGEYQHPEKLFALTITNIIEDKTVPVYGDGRNVRDWLYVQDHCRAIDAVLHRGKEQETYLVGGLTKDTSNIEAIQLILEKLGRSEELIKFIKDRPGHDRRYSIDWTKLQRELDWEPSVTLEEGVERTIAWYQAHPEWWKPLKVQAQDFFDKNYQSKE